MSKQCDIVRDILPLYVDGACSEASAEMVKEHLTACADCNAIYQKLLSHTNEDVLHEESESVIMRHEAKEKQRDRKKITIAVLISIALCIIAIFTAVFLLPIKIDFEPVKIDFPFEVEDVESVEMYHYDGVPASAEKKVGVAESDIKTLYDKFKGLSLKDKTAEETAGADVTSFRFNLSDGTSYDFIYACYGVKNCELKSESGGFKYFTSADIGSYWNNLNKELEATPVNESELPGSESISQNDTLSDYRPMVFVNDAFYGDSGKTISELPANVNSIGTITNTVSQSAPLPEENFYSNNCPTGSEIYCDDEIPERIYIKLSSLDNEEYSIYERID